MATNSKANLKQRVVAALGATKASESADGRPKSSETANARPAANQARKTARQANLTASKSAASAARALPKGSAERKTAMATARTNAKTSRMALRPTSARSGSDNAGSENASGADGGRGQISLAEVLDRALAHMPLEQQSIVRSRIDPLISQAQQHIDGFGSQLSFHPSLDHAHGPDGGLMPPIGKGGLSGGPALLGPPTPAGTMQRQATGMAPGTVGAGIAPQLSQMSGYGSQAVNRMFPDSTQPRRTPPTGER